MSKSGRFESNDGRKRGTGGKRKGAGRKPDWFKAKMAELASSNASIELFEDVIAGKEVDEYIVPESGEQIPVKPKAEVRLKFWKEAAERGYGRVREEVDVTSGGKSLRDILLESLAEGAGRAATTEDKDES